MVSVPEGGVVMTSWEAAPAETVMGPLTTLEVPE